MKSIVRKIVVIDNYDSFTYNLVHYLEETNCEVTVFRNDEFDIDELEDFDKIVLSPGPRLPKDAGLLKQVIKTYAGKKPILGVCLGQQAIAEVFGGTLLNLEKVHHGVASAITVIVENEYLFDGLENQFHVGRYHSWVVAQPLPEVLEVTSVDANNQIMSLRHKIFDIRGVQFHPESVLTKDGKIILNNWVTR